jgi:predicted small metal-binding protein
MADHNLYTCWLGNSFAIEGSDCSYPTRQSGNQGIVSRFGGSGAWSEEENMNPNVSDQQQKNEGRVNLKCSDVGPKNCDWQVSGNSEQEIMRKIEHHGREKHNMTIDDQTRNRVRNINRRHESFYG